MKTVSSPLENGISSSWIFNSIDNKNKTEEKMEN